jgi:hypothetical protein
MNVVLSKPLIAALPLVLIASSLACGPASGASFAAEQIFVDKESGTITAEGNVEISLPDRGISIKAGKVVMGGNQIELPDGGIIEIPGGKVYVEGARFVSEEDHFSFGADAFR